MEKGKRVVLSTTNIILILTQMLLLTRCGDECKVENKYVYFEPVYSTSKEIRDAVNLLPGREVNQAGRIYLKDNYLFINEVGQGIHIYDNSNDISPVPIHFLNIPGNNDLAILGNILYADSYIDLVAFDISKINQAHEVSRIEDFFDPYQFDFYNGEEEAFVTSWKKQENVIIYEAECNAQIQAWGGMYYDRGVAFLESDVANVSSLAIAPSQSPGIGGSMARFTINNNYLYALDIGNVNVVDVTNNKSPQSKGSVSLSWDIETLFPYNDKLFVASQAGMYILDLAQPEAPILLSTYQHLRSCDPVVVEGDYAFVTLRNGTTCEGFLNQLEVIDIKDLANPKLVAVYPMTNPHGLGVDQGTLFICDGDDGLKVYDTQDVLSIDDNQLAHYSDIHAFDVIPFGDRAFLIGNEGLHQYDYSDVNDIKLLSTIPFVK